jgi:hypothetical protein
MKPNEYHPKRPPYIESGTCECGTMSDAGIVTAPELKEVR